MMLAALAIKLTSPHGPVFFSQTRVGLDGKPFELDQVPLHGAGR